jgi:hypothetical protein
MLSIEKKDLETILNALKSADYYLKLGKPSANTRIVVLKAVDLIENQYLNKKPNYKL